MQELQNLINETTSLMNSTDKDLFDYIDKEKDSMDKTIERPSVYT